MDDTLACPICRNKLRNISHSNMFLSYIDKTSDFTERICVGTNHIIQLYLDKPSKKIDFLRVSLDPKYSKYLEVDFLHNKCRILCMKNSDAQTIDIAKMVELDFPSLEKLKERIALYVVLS